MNQIFSPREIRHMHAAEMVPAFNRADTIKAMADHLLAGVTEGLDLSSDFDVIRCLTNTPERYRANVVSYLMDDAIAEARQVLVAAIMERSDV